MENQATRNFRLFPTPEELIEANNYEQNCYLKITKNDIKNGDLTTSFDYTMESSISSDSFSSSSSSSDLLEDATSPSTTSSSSSNGPLFQLSDLMDKLPIKRGLSKYYEGKSESFTSLASVGNLEDLAKRENPFNKNKKKFKLCKNNYFRSPKSSISKKSSSSYSRSPFSSSSSILVGRTCSNNFRASCRPPTSIPPVQKEF